MRLAINLVVMVVMGLFAKQKGFNPWLWVLAAGIPGLIILLLMPSATTKGIDEATQEKRRKTGNKVGTVLTVIAVILIIVVVIIAMLLRL